MAVPRYTRIAMLLHWLVAALIIVNVALAYSADEVPDAYVRPVVDLHKSIGLTVLGLVLLRVLWRLAHPPPAMPRSYKRSERFAAHAAHLGLYALIAAVPLSGYMHDSAWKGAPTHPLRLYGLVDFPRIGVIASLPPEQKEQFHSEMFDVHVWLAYVLYGLFALHVLGALKHQFLDGEPELERMLPGG
jgi:cytochrome b561